MEASILERGWPVKRFLQWKMQWKMANDQGMAIGHLDIDPKAFGVDWSLGFRHWSFSAKGKFH
jgi:hypothetical protein